MPMYVWYRLCMDTTLFGISALQFHDTPLQAHQCSLLMDAPLPGGATIGSTMPAIARRASSPGDARAIQEHMLGALKGVGLPVHLIGEARSARRSPHIRWHRQEIPYVPDDLQRIAPGLLVTTPRRTLLDLARSMTLVQLLRVLFSWCGLYAICPSTARMKLALSALLNEGVIHDRMVRRLFAFYGSDGLPLVSPRAGGEHLTWDGDASPWEPCFDRQGRLTDLWKRPPLVEQADLAAYAQGLELRDGVARLRRAADLVMPGSASPLETTHALLAHLPRKLGGEGLLKPQLNRQVALSAEAARALGHPSVVCDEAWPDDLGGLLPVCVEVDGVSFHEVGGVVQQLPSGGMIMRRDDSSRASALESMGFTVISSTYAQMANIDRWELLMNRLATALEIERKRQTPAFIRQRSRLREELFGPPLTYGVGV